MYGMTASGVELNLHPEIKSGAKENFSSTRGTDKGDKRTRVRHQFALLCY